MNNIILIGMPASGKSTIGKKLSEKLKMDFVDTDYLIEQEQGMSLQEIINKKGNNFFWSCEERILTQLNLEKTVIATGGSAVLFPKAMEHLREGGKVIYLSQSLEKIKKRLHNLESRGVTLEEGESVETLYNYRVPLYEKESDLTIIEGNKSVKEIVNEISEACISF